MTVKTTFYRYQTIFFQRVNVYTELDFKRLHREIEIKIFKSCFWQHVTVIEISLYIFSSPQGELIVWDLSRRPSVRPFTLLNMNISETS